MNSCSQSLLQSSVANRSCLLVPSGEIDTTNSIPTTLPLEIWNKIFNYLGFQDLKLFTEHKVKVLKKPLDGNEDNHRLMMSNKFIFHKKDFLNAIKSVYSVALCCKEFYGLTQRERKLLINAAQWSRFDREFLFSEQIPTRNKQDENISFKTDEIQEIIRTPSYKDLIPKLALDTFNTNVINERLIDQASILLVESRKLKPLKLDLNEFKPLNLDKIFEKIKVTELLVNENQISTKQGQPSDSNEEWKCVIQ